MLISDQYQALNKQLHEDKPHYGVSGQKYVKQVLQLMQHYGAETILDYGCGKRTLEKGLGFEIANYDPCIEGLDARPEPADLVVCTDVLEHIEPDCLSEVLNDLQRLTKKAGFFTIATGPAKKTLADGRNAHLIQEGPHWWLQRLLPRFRIVKIMAVSYEIFVVVEPNEA